MKILDYAIAKKLFGGSGSGEVSGTIDINENGTYNVAKYAHANVNIPIGVAIEVSELPQASADTVGKVYKVGEDYYVGEESVVSWTVGETLGDKIYFDTTQNLWDYSFDGYGETLLNAQDDAALNSTRLFINRFSIGDGREIMMISFDTVIDNVEGSAIIFIDGKGISADEVGQLLGIPISEYGWTMGEVDFSAIAHCEVTVNNLASYGNLAYKEKSCTFKNLDNPPILQEKTVTENGEVVADSGYDGLSKVTVNVASGGGEAQAVLNALIDRSITEFESDVTNVGDYVFYRCMNLVNLNLPNATTFGSNVISYCNSLKSINLPNLTSGAFGSISYCAQLATIIIPKIASIGQSMMVNNYKLTKVIIGTNLTTVATLANTSAFNQCYHIHGTKNTPNNPTGAKDGYIYVPFSLVADYRVATNWATYATQIMPYVATVDELANIDGTTYDKACVGADYVEYTYNGTNWEVYR